MAVLLKYMVVREYMDGRRGKRAKSYYRWPDQPRLEVGGLYLHLGHGFPDMQRVLSVEKTDIKDQV